MTCTRITLNHIPFEAMTLLIIVTYKQFLINCFSYSITLSKSWSDKQKDQCQTNYNNFILLENFERDSVDIALIFCGNYSF